MSYRIKLPAKTLQVDEAHMLSGLSISFIGYRNIDVPCWSALGVFLLAGAVVGGVFYVDRQAAQKAQELEREASRLLMLLPPTILRTLTMSLKEAIARYRQIVDQYPRTPAAPLALYHLGNALVQAKDLSAAIETYQRFLMLYGSNPSLAGLVQQRLAYVIFEGRS